MDRKVGVRQCYGCGLKGLFLFIQVKAFACYPCILNKSSSKGRICISSTHWKHFSIFYQHKSTNHIHVLPSILYSIGIFCFCFKRLLVLHLCVGIFPHHGHRQHALGHEPKQAGMLYLLVSERSSAQMPCGYEFRLSIPMIMHETWPVFCVWDFQRALSAPCPDPIFNLPSLCIINEFRRRRQAKRKSSGAEGRVKSLDAGSVYRVDGRCICSR